MLEKTAGGRLRVFYTFFKCGWCAVEKLVLSTMEPLYTMWMDDGKYRE